MAWLELILAYHDVSAFLDYRREAPFGRLPHPSVEHLMPLFVAWGATPPTQRLRRGHTGTTFSVLSIDTLYCRKVSTDLRRTTQPLPISTGIMKSARLRRKAVMKSKSSEQQALAERYLFNRLSPSEARDFESDLREDPALIDALGLPEVATRALSLLSQQRHRALLRSPAWLHRTPPLWLVPTLASALLLVSAATISLYRNQQLLLAQEKIDHLELARGQIKPPEKSLIVLAPLGGSDSHIPTYPIGSRETPTLAELRIDLSHVKNNLFRVAIKRSDGTYWGRFDNLLKDTNGAIRLALNSGAFTTGSYEATVESLDWRGEPSLTGQMILTIN